MVLGSVEDRVDILKAKKKLTDLGKYKNIRIEACLSRQEAISKQNFGLLLSELGGAGKKLRVAGNRRIMRKDQEEGDRKSETGHGERASGSRGSERGDPGSGAHVQ